MIFEDSKKGKVKLFGLPFPETQAEYCLMCFDRGSEFCPCNIYNKLPEESKFPLDEDELEEYIYKNKVK